MLDIRAGLLYSNPIMIQRYTVLRLIPAPAIMLIIWLLSSMSALPHLDIDISFTDKIEHFIAYSTLAFFAGFYVKDSCIRENRLLCLLFLAATASIYGVTDEWHQSFVPNRDVSALDWLSDTVGGLAGAGLYLLLAKKRLSGNSARAVN